MTKSFLLCQLKVARARLKKHLNGFLLAQRGFSGKEGVRSAECGVRSPNSCRLHVFHSVKKTECGKRGVLRKNTSSHSRFSTRWKTRSVENAES